VRWSARFKNGVAAEGGPGVLTVEPLRVEQAAKDLLALHGGFMPVTPTGPWAPPDGRAEWFALLAAMWQYDPHGDFTVIAGAPPDDVDFTAEMDDPPRGAVL